MRDKQKSILMVDDVDDVREGLSQLLQDEGYSVSTASNGRKALKVLNDMQIDLVITDILMPEMDGMELVNRAKELYPDIRYILISGGGRQLEGDYDYLEVAKSLTGVNTLLKKPFKPNELIDMVHSLFV